MKHKKVSRQRILNCNLQKKKPQVALFQKKSKVLVSGNIIKEKNPIYLVQLQVPTQAFDKELEKISFNGRADISKVLYNMLIHRKPLEKTGARIYVSEYAQTDNLDDTKTLVLNLMR